MVSDRPLRWRYLLDSALVFNYARSYARHRNVGKFAFREKSIFPLFVWFVGVATRLGAGEARLPAAARKHAAAAGSSSAAGGFPAVFDVPIATADVGKVVAGLDCPPFVEYLFYSK